MFSCNPTLPWPYIAVDCEQVTRTAGLEMWDKSVATPGVPTTSYRANSDMRGHVLRRRDNGYRNSNR
jgi:hypothetical protein